MTAKKKSIVLIPVLLLIFCFTCGCQSMAEKDTPTSGEQTISVAISAPSPAWTLTIEEVWLHDEELWIIAEAKRKEGVIAAQVITDIEDSVTIEAPDYPHTIFIHGKTWNWENETGPSIQFIEDTSMLTPRLEQGKRLYPTE